jgi:hypothetical protein
MQTKRIRNTILLVMVAWGCALMLETATESAKQDSALASEVIGAPALEVPEWFFDFGEMKDGTDYLHEFIIRNRGTAVLEITKVQPG